MKFAMSCFGLSARHYPEIAQVAEANGFESIWVPEHLVFPAEMPPLYSYNHDTGLPPMDSSAAAYDPWVVIGAMASVTETIVMGTSVFILPLRHPIAVARSLVTLDRISGGRVEAGVGAGWLVDEFEITGLSPKDRGRRMDECMEVMRKLWSPEPVIEHKGEFFDFGQPITFEPKPVRKKPIPLLVGGVSKPALRRAGRLGDGWIAHKPLRMRPATAEENAQDLAELKAEIATIQRHREEAGRADQPFELVAGLAGTVDDVRVMEELGVTRYPVGPSVNPLRRDTFIDWIKRFADEVIAECN
jgi:probable F420-dependent oxidoreductase